jgi:hypothetical protein
MQDEIFVGQNKEVLDAFLRSEAKCFPRYHCGDIDKDDFSLWKLNETGEEYVKELKEIIMDEIRKKCPEGFDYATFYSYGNAGSLALSIMISPTGKYWDWQKGSIAVNLCTCGHLNCWGGITVLKSKYEEMMEKRNADK